MADVKSLEHPTLKVPYEILNKKFRTAQKTLDREVSHVQQGVTEVERCLSQENEVKVTQITNLLGGMVEKLQVLKRKAEESISEELAASNVCKRRLEHLKDHAAVTGGNSVPSDHSIVMADRGFKQIESMLNKKGCTLVRPPSVSADEKMSKEDAILTKPIASVRIHIERVIKRIRDFKMLGPHAVIGTAIIQKLDFSMKIACAIINLQ